jgi:tRNA (guanine37-N1)-methyltransferase
MTTFHLVTLFPDAFDSYLGESILKRAIEDKKIRVRFYNPRDFAKNKWHRVDQRPYGGGPGMVIEALPVIKAIEKAIKNSKKGKAKIVFFSPSGKQLTNDYADKAAKNCSDIILVCGRYEGIDARVKKAFKMDEVSVGPFVLTGGELPAMIVIDSIARRIPGILGNIHSVEENRVSSPDVYTRPEIIEYKGKKLRVPAVLLSGHQANIEAWKKGKNKGI